MRRALLPLVAVLAAGLLVFGGTLPPWTVLHARLVTGGRSPCGELVPERVPAARAGWWWLWNALGRVAHAEGDERTRRIVIDVLANRLYLYEDGRLLRQYVVAVGKPRTPTPPGEWRVVSKSRDWGGGFGTRWIGINVPWGIYGIHGTDTPHLIGGDVSAGCVRMLNRDVEELFGLVAVGTPVTIIGPLPTDLQRRDRMRAGSSGKEALVLQVRLRQAGFDPGAVDGRFGPATERRVRELQGFYGFPVTGELDRDQLALVRYPR